MVTTLLETVPFPILSVTETLPSSTVTVFAARAGIAIIVTIATTKVSKTRTFANLVFIFHPPEFVFGITFYHLYKTAKAGISFSPSPAGGGGSPSGLTERVAVDFMPSQSKIKDFCQLSQRESIFYFSVKEAMISLTVSCAIRNNCRSSVFKFSGASAIRNDIGIRSPAPFSFIITISPSA